MDDAEASLELAEAQVQSAKATLRLAQEGFREEDIAAAIAAREATAARVAAAETALADTVLAAPSDGVILTRIREKGAIVASGAPVYAESLNDPAWVRAYVDEPNLGRIHPGMKALIYTDTRPETPYRGQIGFISPRAEFTPKSVETPELRTALVYRLRVIVDGAGEGLRQGMPVTVRLPWARDGAN